MMLDCPHCFRTVVPLPSGQCPACRRNTKEPGQHAAERTVLEVGEKSTLPEVCCHCAALTRRAVTITRSAAAAADGTSPHSRYDEDTGAARFLVKLAFGSLLTLLASAVVGGLSSGGRGSIRVAVRMRQCAECARQGRVEPIQVDFDYYRMRFAVHRRFAEHFRQLNSRA
jgi:hypothetical protein